MGATAISLSRREREGARAAQPRGKGEGSVRRAPALTLPPLRGSLPLPVGEGHE